MATICVPSSPSQRNKMIEKHLHNSKKNEFVWKALPDVISRSSKDDSIIKEPKLYHRGAYLGKGATSRVYELQDTTNGRVYAGKIISKQTLSKRARAKLITEIQIHKSLNNDTVVKFEEFFEDKRFVYLLLELCPHKSLLKLLQYRKRLSEDEVRYYLRDMFNALEYFKGEKILHRDLKLGNILLDGNMKLKIADFGLAAKLSSVDERKRSVCGTPNYIAPEVLQGKEDGHSFEVDIWSVGVIMYTLLVGKPPFESKEFSVTCKRITENIYSFPDDIELSVDAMNLIRELLHPDAKCRPNSSQALAHPFFANYIIPNYVPISSLRFVPHLKDEKIRTADDFWEESKASQTVTAKPFIFAGNNSNSGLKKTVPKSPLAPTSLNRKNTPSSVSRKRSRSVFNGDENDPTLETPTKKRKLNENTLSEQQIHTALDCLNNLLEGKPIELPVQSVNEIVHVTKWTESKSVGVGFQLSNHVTSIYFNDDTKLAFNPATNYFHYWQPRIDPVNEHISLNDDSERIFHLKDGEPAELQKKIDILVYFRGYFLRLKDSDLVTTLKKEMSTSIHNEERQIPPCDYIQRVLRSKHAMTFKLSNGSIQVNFFDRSKVIAHFQTGEFIFVSGKSEQTLYKFNHFDTSNNLVSSRARYMRDSLVLMLKLSHHYPPASKSQTKGSTLRI